LPCCKVTIERTDGQRRKQYNRINRLTNSSSGFTFPWRIAKEALHLINIAHPAHKDNTPPAPLQLSRALWAGFVKRNTTDYDNIN
jgi:hypothetical protein